MELKRCIGGCVTPFLIAFLFDVLGLILLFVGIFANVRIFDRFYGDFLIYSGSLLIFFSLALWLMWYVGNIPVSEEEDDDGGLKKSSSIVQLARKLSERLSQKLTGEPRVKCVEDDEDGSQVGPHKASRVTWGRSTAYHNKGYDDCLDSPSMEKKVEMEPEEKTEM